MQFLFAWLLESGKQRNDAPLKLTIHSPVLDLLSPSHSPLVVVLQFFSRLLLEPVQYGMVLLRHHIDEDGFVNEGTLHIVVHQIWAAICALHIRLTRRLMQQHYQVLAVCDRRQSLAARRRFADSFCAPSFCCLRFGSGKSLYRMAQIDSGIEAGSNSPPLSSVLFSQRWQLLFATIASEMDLINQDMEDVHAWCKANACENESAELLFAKLVLHQAQMLSQSFNSACNNSATGHTDTDTNSPPEEMKREHEKSCAGIMLFHCTRARQNIWKDANGYQSEEFRLLDRDCWAQTKLEWGRLSQSEQDRFCNLGMHGGLTALDMIAPLPQHAPAPAPTAVANRDDSIQSCTALVPHTPSPSPFHRCTFWKPPDVSPDGLDRQILCSESTPISISEYTKFTANQTCKQASEKWNENINKKIGKSTDYVEAKLAKCCFETGYCPARYELLGVSAPVFHAGKLAFERLAKRLKDAAASDVYGFRPMQRRPLLCFQAVSLESGSIIDTRFVVLAYCCWQPVFQSLIDYIPVHGDEASLDEIPFTLKINCQDHVQLDTSVEQERFRSIFGQPVVHHSFDFIDHVLIRTHHNVSWNMHMVDYRFHALEDATAGAGFLRAVGIVKVHGLPFRICVASQDDGAANSSGHHTATGNGLKALMDIDDSAHTSWTSKQPHAPKTKTIPNQVPKSLSAASARGRSKAFKPISHATSSKSPPSVAEPHPTPSPSTKIATSATGGSSSSGYVTAHPSPDEMVVPAVPTPPLELVSSSSSSSSSNGPPQSKNAGHDSFLKEMITFSLFCVWKMIPIQV